MRGNRWAAATLAALSLASIPALAAETAKKTFPDSGLRSLRIETEAGAVEVDGSAAREVRVEIRQPFPERCEITTEVRGDALLLQARSKPRPGWKRLSEGCEAGFSVRAPARLALDASAGSGDMRMRGMRGGLSLNTGSGDIRLQDCAGELSARLGSGNLEGTARAGKVRVHTGSGAVRLRGLSGSAELRCGSGEVELAWAEKPRAGEVSVRSGSGGVVLSFPAGTELQSRVITGSGSFTNELVDKPGAALSVFVESGSGDVRIVNRPAH